MTTPKLPAFALQAAVEPTSFNAQRRTFDVVWSTGERIRFFDFELGEFDLTLGLEPENVDLDFARRGAPVLDSHQRFSVRDVVGCIDAIDVDGQRGTATLRLSPREDVAAIAKDIESGVLRFVSVGTRLRVLRDITEEGDPVRHLFAALHEPLEISLAPIPKDRGAVMQSDQSTERFSVELITQQEAHNMPEIIDDQKKKPGKTPANDTILQAERERVSSILELTDKAGLPQLARELIDKGKTVDQARAIILDTLAEQSDAVGIRSTVSFGRDEADHRAELVELFGDVVAARGGGPTIRPQAEPFGAYTLPRMAEEMLRRSGARVPTSRDAIVTQALHSTSDFPEVLANAFNKRLRAAYEQPAGGVLSLSRESSARDFRAKRIVQLGEAPELLKVGDNSEFKRGTMADAAESYKVDTYGRIFGISRQAIVNDDLDAFAQASDRFGQAAREFERGFLVDLVNANPLLADGIAVFAAGHNNLSGTGAALSVTTLGAAREAIRRQKGVDGKTAVALEPDVLLVPAALETAAEQVLSTIAAPSTSAANPFAGRLRLVVDPRLDDDDAAAWYLVASGSEGLEHSYLEGARGVQVFTREGFDVDGVEIKARLDFGAGWVDYRSWFKNPGA